MADATSRKKLKEIRSQCGNNICVECGKLNPQWERIAFYYATILEMFLQHFQFLTIYHYV